ncbi:uncharacterized protein DUF4202 [Dyadobacter jejuensis]|uniref:Uncharacterized protein DUF4202 n=1 Tax=Dyadobacter jejuensis TaxID=1082580 RepID=A0A316ANC5_9BACT|nr:DUF4202 domain-containing protein [Dyadobacter jejuensis]PWJ58809.1 uncharacterized protein DUF4202 [Dyadobacter jejuensis]
MKKFEDAIARFDEYNRRDPNMIIHQGQRWPQEYLFALMRSEWVRKLKPDASDQLMLAAHCQHLGRWAIARKSYPDGRLGYLKWRSDLGKYHAQIASEILSAVGYSEAEIKEVTSIVLKQKIKQNQEVQTIEDALCLVFLQYQYDDLLEKHSEDKMVSILRKTWAKMSDVGRDYAVRLSLSPRGRALLNLALNS